jgi:cytoskeletal protein CcmA (bactofilin family)
MSRKTFLDGSTSGNLLDKCYNYASNRLNVETQPLTINGSVDVNVNSASTIMVHDGTNALKINSDGSINVSGSVSGSVEITNFPADQAIHGSVSVNNLPAIQTITGTVNVSSGTISLPPGASTSTLQIAGNVSLASIDTKLTNPLPISVGSLPLPTNAATSTLQTSGNNLLNSIDAKLTNPLPVSGSISIVNFPASQAVTGSFLTDTQLRATPVPISVGALPLPSTASTSTLQTTGNTSLSSIDSKTPSIGQKLSSSSSPVVISSDQSVIPINDNGGSLTVDGTIISNQGTSNTVSNGWPTKITDGISVLGTQTDPFFTSQIINQNQQLVNANKVYSISVDLAAATASVDNPLILIRNPIGSGKKMYVISLRAGTQVANVSFMFKIFTSPVVTVNGSVLASISRHIGGGAPVSSILVTTLPTVSSNGSSLTGFIQGQNSNSIDLNNEAFLIELEPNASMLITGSPMSNNKIANFSLSWLETT